jgi:hypothetical protein
MLDIVTSALRPELSALEAVKLPTHHELCRQLKLATPTDACRQIQAISHTSMPYCDCLQPSGLKDILTHGLLRDY